MASSVPQDVLDRLSSLLGENQTPSISIPQSFLLQEDDLAFYLVFKLFTTKHLSLPTLSERLIALWSGCCSSPPRISDYHGDDVFLAKFDDKSDVDRIAEGAPWLLEGDLVSVLRCKPYTLPSAYPFNISPLWVQLHGLPVDLLTTDVAILLGNQLGYTIPPSSQEAESWSKFIRVRVNVNVSEPLSKRLQLALPSDETITVQIRYEDLPEYCHLCRVIGHNSEDDCDSIKNLKADIHKDLPDPSEAEAFLHSKINEFKCKDTDSLRVLPSSHLPCSDLSTAKATVAKQTTARGAIRYNGSLRVKVVMRVKMDAVNKRHKAMKIASRSPGVQSVEAKQSTLVVVGGGINLVALIQKLRKKMGFAELVEDNEEEEETVRQKQLFVDIELYAETRRAVEGR